MRILLVISQFHPIVGGAERQAQALARGLMERGHEVEVVTRRRAGLPAKESVDGIPVLRGIRTTSVGPLYTLTYVGSLSRLVLSPAHRADVIHVTNVYLDAVTAIWTRRWHASPVVVRPACAGYYGDLARLRRFRVWLIYPGPGGVAYRQLLRVAARADGFIANSEELREELVAAGMPADRVVRIPNGVDTVRFHPGPSGARAEARKQLGLPLGPLLVFAGRLDPQKNLEGLLDAVQPLLVRHPDLHVLLIGDGPLRGQLESRVAAGGLRHRVTLSGLVEDVAPYLRTADIFVLPSLGEGMPNALLEAMATGLPCIATRIGGCTDLIRDGESGVLVPAGNPGALGEAIGSLLASPEQRVRLGEAARQVAVTSFSLDRMLDAYEACYREAAARCAGRGAAVRGPAPPVSG